MTATHVKSLCESTRTKLSDAIAKMEQFVNAHSLQQLNAENDPAMDEFYKGYLADTRHLLVFSEVAYEKLGVSLRRPNFNIEYAEKVLYEVYHSSVNSFFYPKHECYSEDGRYAYTGQDAIRFRKKPVREVRDLTIELSKIFENLREDLSYYETDYITQRRMQGEKV
ncbi:YpuI family protein [Paenibacillus sp. YYML68]|uniref:YpuI family protein n=1 Tax=Paenibacillus sp. YYML68 TaxID=2909250 RepID=UPI002491FB47|nr:YpuI family protein [Paenibacillus sp. YYML68]